MSVNQRTAVNDAYAHFSFSLQVLPIGHLALWEELLTENMLTKAHPMVDGGVVLLLR